MNLISQLRDKLFCSTCLHGPNKTRKQLDSNLQPWRLGHNDLLRGVHHWVRRDVPREAWLQPETPRLME